MSNPPELKRIEWLKVSILDRVKRIYNPSKDLKCLSNQIKNHFKELSTLQFSNNSQQIQDNEFTIQWVTQNELILIEDNDQLEEIYKMHGFSKDHKIPRFQIGLKENDSLNIMAGRNLEIQSSEYLENGQSQFQSAYLSQSEIDNLQVLVRNQNSIEAVSSEQKHYEEVKSEVSEEVESEEESGSSDEEYQDFELLQDLRHQIRFRIEKSAIDLFEKELQIEKYESSIPEGEFEEPYPEEEEEEEKIENSQQIDISVSVTSNQLHNQNQQRQLPILQSFKKFFQKKILPSDKQLYSKIISYPELFLEAKTNSNCSLRWTVQNQTQVDWPRAVQLVLVFSQPVALINNQDINRSLKPGETEDIEINLFIPQDIKEQHQIVMFRLKDKESFIGQPLIAFIKVTQEDLDESDLSKSQHKLRAQAEDFTIYKLSDEQLLGMGSLLVDEGFGSFDRCYNLVRALRGDIKKARDYLSQLIFYECQF